MGKPRDRAPERLERSPALTLDDSGGQRVNLTKGTFCKVGPTIRTGTQFPLRSGMPLRQPRKIGPNAVQDGVRTSVRVQRALAGRVSPRRWGRSLTLRAPRTAKERPYAWRQSWGLILAIQKRVTLVLRPSFGSFGRSAVSPKTAVTTLCRSPSPPHGPVCQVLADLPQLDKHRPLPAASSASARSSFASFCQLAKTCKTSSTAGCAIPPAGSSFISFCQLAVSDNTVTPAGCATPAARSSFTNFRRSSFFCKTTSTSCVVR